MDIVSYKNFCLFLLKCNEWNDTICIVSKFSFQLLLFENRKPKDCTTMFKPTESEVCSLFSGLNTHHKNNMQLSINLI